MNTELRIVIGSDHKGVELKEAAIELLKAWGFEVEDVGTYSKESCNYADYANAVCKRVSDGRADRGVLICFSGLGMSIAANRWNGIRATLTRTPQVAALSRQHNNSNVMCLAAAFVNSDMLDEILSTWLNAEFEGGRHQVRVDMMQEIENK
jgi:glycine hydroxymethyltransferase